MGLWELRGLTDLTTLDLSGSCKVSDARLQHLTLLTELSSSAPTPPGRGGTHLRLPSPPSSFTLDHLKSSTFPACVGSSAFLLALFNLHVSGASCVRPSDRLPHTTYRPLDPLQIP